MAKKFEIVTPNKRSTMARRLLNLRKKFKWSQVRLAEEWNVSPGTIALWETSSRPISGPILRLIEIYEVKNEN